MSAPPFSALNRFSFAEKGRGRVVANVSTSKLDQTISLKGGKRLIGIGKDSNMSGVYQFRKAFFLYLNTEKLLKASHLTKLEYLKSDSKKVWLPKAKIPMLSFVCLFFLSFRTGRVAHFQIKSENKRKSVDLSVKKKRAFVSWTVCLKRKKPDSNEEKCWGQKTPKFQVHLIVVSNVQLWVQMV